MVNKCAFAAALVLSSCTAPATAAEDDSLDDIRQEIIEVCKKASLSSMEIYETLEKGQLTMDDINYIVNSRVGSDDPVGEHLKKTVEKYFDGEYLSKEGFVYDTYQYCVNEAGIGDQH